MNLSTETTAITTDFEIFLLFLGGAMELITNLVGIPLSIANLCLVARTSVIHRNMKFILIFQSFFFLLSVSCRFVICLFKFILWDPIGPESTHFFLTIARMNLIGIYSRNFVPHILIIERILATLFVRSYEQHRGYLFSMLWSPFALVISIYITFNTFFEKATLTSIVTTTIQLVIGIVELVIFYHLCRHNIKIYQKMLQKEASHNLSIRYQLSENIRIGKQLIPPLSLNLGNIFAGIIVLLWAYFGLSHLFLLITLVTNLNSFFGLLIELFIITCHPFLKRNLFNLLHGLCNICSNHRIGDQSLTIGASNVYSDGIAQTNLISGKTLMDQPKTEDHFAMLKNAWENSTDQK